jgi:hypothetical protein
MGTLVIFGLASVAGVALATVAITRHCTKNHRAAVPLWAMVIVLCGVAARHAADLYLISANTAEVIFTGFSIIVVVAACWLLITTFMEVWRTAHPKKAKTATPASSVHASKEASEA